MSTLKCVGWWEQAGLGRQQMNDLQISFSSGQIIGAGTDMVGDFELKGELNEEQVYLRKQYVRQHAIDYYGTSVGEGAYAGTWSCYGTRGGRWFIGVVSAREANDIQELEP